MQDRLTPFSEEEINTLKAHAASLVLLPSALQCLCQCPDDLVAPEPTLMLCSGQINPSFSAPHVFLQQWFVKLSALPRPAGCWEVSHIVRVFRNHEDAIDSLRSKMDVESEAYLMSPVDVTAPTSPYYGQEKHEYREVMLNDRVWEQRHPEDGLAPPTDPETPVQFPLKMIAIWCQGEVTHKVYVSCYFRSVALRQLIRKALYEFVRFITPSSPHPVCDAQ